MPNTLYIDLLSTETEDFIGNFRKDFRYKERTFIANIPADCLVFWPDSGDEIAESELKKHLEAGYIEVRERRKEKSILFRPFGYAKHKYDDDNPLSGSSFGLEVIRFEPDRLRIVFDDYSDSGVHEKLFMAWLEPRYEFVIQPRDSVEFKRMSFDELAEVNEDALRMQQHDIAGMTEDIGQFIEMFHKFTDYTKEMEQKVRELENKLQQTLEQKKDRPWELIPDIGYDRKLVELWHQGETMAEIAKKVGKDISTIENKIRDLRESYEDEIPNLLPRRRRS